MSATKFSLNTKLSDSQINDLARPLMDILEVFYSDPKNEEDFQKWLRNVEATNALEKSS
jgi:hypothetical protein